jgi:general secretion pathway protein K
MTESNPRGGMVLVTVLWAITLCSALVMAAAVSFRSFAGIVAIDRDRMQGDALLTAGLEVAAALAADWPDKPLLDRATTFDLSTGSVRAQISDEGGRIDIGKAPAEFLVGLFLSVGAPHQQAEQIARAIVNLRSRDKPQSAQSVKTNSPNASATSVAFFTDVAQIAQIPGMRREWVTAIRPLTTVFGAETVNPLTAPASVIASVPGVDQTRLRAFLAARRDFPSDVDRLATILGAGKRYVMARPQQVVSVQLAATLVDGYGVAARAIIVLLPQDQQPYRILLWNPLSLSATH